MEGRADDRHLPQHLLCRVLSLVPLSKSKLQLGLVNKAWLQALIQPQSHSKQLPAKVSTHHPLFWPQEPHLAALGLM